MSETDRDLLANFCNNVGMSISTLFDVFAKKVINENKIPFNIEYEDPFYPKLKLNNSFALSILDLILSSSANL